MYSSNRFPPDRGRIVAFEPRKISLEQQDDDVLSVPSPDEPDESASAAIKPEATDFRQLGSISSAKPLFRFFNTDIWLDDIIILAVIVILIAEGSFDSIVLPVLVFLFLSGFGLKF